MLGPALLVILVILVYPVAFLLYQSVFLTFPGIDTRFIGVGNYLTIFESAEFRSYFRHTLVYSTGSLLVSMTSGLIIALGTTHVRRRWLRNVHLTVLMFAWAIPIAVVALIRRWILQATSSACQICFCCARALSRTRSPGSPTATGRCCW